MMSSHLYTKTTHLDHFHDNPPQLFADFESKPNSAPDRPIADKSAETPVSTACARHVSACYEGLFCLIASSLSLLRSISASWLRAA